MAAGPGPFYGLPVQFTDYDVRVSAYAVLVEAGQILLALGNEPSGPQWTMPGGGAEFGERLEETAIREVYEETGYQVQLNTLLGINDLWVSGAERLGVPGRPMRALRVIYTASITGGELTDEVDGSTDEAQWVPLADVGNLKRVGLVDEAIALWRAGER